MHNRPTFRCPRDYFSNTVRFHLLTGPKQIVERSGTLTDGGFSLYHLATVERMELAQESLYGERARM